MSQMLRLRDFSRRLYIPCDIVMARDKNLTARGELLEAGDGFVADSEAGVSFLSEF